MTNTASTVLHIDSSARSDDSTTRKLGKELVQALAPTQIIKRDLSNGLPFINDAWVGANFTAEENRNEEQKTELALSDTLVEELKQADKIVIGVPTYNFGIPASLKAWVDLVARARLTFKYTENGPEGLLTGKKAYLVFASGGVAAGSDYDFATGYMKHVLGFMGITDVTVIAADQTASRGEAAIEEARSQIGALAA